VAAKILDGNKIRDEILNELRNEIDTLKKAGIVPGLAAVLCGDNPASQIYVRSKVKTCESLGLSAKDHAAGNQHDGRDARPHRFAQQAERHRRHPGATPLLPD
jgi:methylenetetrahydrofolate dehydrogenase (NADP+)/methenyltetrahydrofolate cyclohydrolase